MSGHAVRLGLIRNALLFGLLACGGKAPAETPAPLTGLPPGYTADAPNPPYAGPHPARLTRPPEIVTFPIALGAVGPAEPLFAGPRQYPFVCDTEASGLGPPLADNAAGVGTALAGGGFSQDCLAPTQAWYYYRPRGKKDFERWHEGSAEVDTVDVNGRSVPLVVRVEMGTLNRFIYLLAALKGEGESLAAPSSENWNRRLIYQFFGGVGIGHRQGRLRLGKLLRERGDELAQGYALVASTGTSTENHYNIWLAEDTALRVKRQFVARYGAPEYAVGVGGSGGAIQQYLLAQNRPGLIDAAIAQYSYPDMVTQTIPVFDCELLEHYFDVSDDGNPLWRQAEHRGWIEGFRADNQQRANDRLRKLERVKQMAYSARGDTAPVVEGQTECVVGWRGLTPLVLNPHFMHFKARVSDEIYQRVRWSHFEDLKAFYGTDRGAYAAVPWDNVGVQYGLVALRRGQIGVEQFLDLNARIGGWKQPADLRPERFWLLAGGESELVDFSPWSAHNMLLASAPGQPAPRTAGNRAAMAAAYRSGLVFLGRLDIPLIDERHYLDPELDMHHASGSFSARARLLAAQGHAGNQAIWISDKQYTPTVQAFAAIEAWWRAKQAAPGRSWAEVRPPAADDRCFDAQGQVLASGDGVWDGDWNGRPDGACLRRYPIYGTPRTAAGAPLAGDLFQCALLPVEQAIAAGVYAPVDLAPRRDRLKAIFPRGVCDYRRPDVARPAGLDAAPPVAAR